MELLTRLRRAMGRPIQEKFRSAVPTYHGDGSSWPSWGRSCQPALARGVYGEGEVFLIKGGLFLSGVRPDGSAYEGVGTIWKAALGLAGVGIVVALAQGRLAPYALHLPHGF